MAILSYLIWNGSPELYEIGSILGSDPIILRWYGLFFALGFLITQQILYYIFKKEGKPEKDVDTLTIYMVVATIIGARLGHVIFYEPDRYLDHPLRIFNVMEGGLASHGATIAILLALWIYARKKKPAQNYLQTLDRIVILVALASSLIRVGNFFNSEIIGKPTDKSWGVVFVNRLTNHLEKNPNVEIVQYTKSDRTEETAESDKPVNLYIFFKPGVTEGQADYLLADDVNAQLSGDMSEFFRGGLTYSIQKLENGRYAARARIIGIARHPAQLYESLSHLALFILLYALWIYYKRDLPDGRLLGIFLMFCFGSRFLLEFLKENQVSFENNMPLNMGQILSIPLILAGVFVFIQSFRKKETDRKKGE